MSDQSRAPQPVCPEPNPTTLSGCLCRWAELQPAVVKAIEWLRRLRQRKECPAEYERTWNAEHDEAEGIKYLALWEVYTALEQAIQRECPVAVAAAELAGIDSTPLVLFGEHLALDDMAGALANWESALAVVVRLAARSQAPPELPTLWYGGGRSYSLDGQTPVTVSPEEHTLLCMFLRTPRSYDTEELAKLTGVTNVSRAMKQLANKFPGTIRQPGAVAKGEGYFARVRTAPKSALW